MCAGVGDLWQHRRCEECAGSGVFARPSGGESGSTGASLRVGVVVFIRAGSYGHETFIVRILNCFLNVDSRSWIWIQRVYYKVVGRGSSLHILFFHFSKLVRVCAAGNRVQEYLNENIETNIELLKYGWRFRLEYITHILLILLILYLYFSIYIIYIFFNIIFGAWNHSIFLLLQFSVPVWNDPVVVVVGVVATVSRTIQRRALLYATAAAVSEAVVVDDRCALSSFASSSFVWKACARRLSDCTGARCSSWRARTAGTTCNTRQLLSCWRGCSRERLVFGFDLYHTVLRWNIL